MQIQPVSVPIPNASTSSTTNSTSSASSSGSSGSSSDPAQSTDTMFMDLLTAQLKNQSPFDPVDPMQFTSQLVQFNMLDQLTQINSVLQQSLGNPSTPSANGSVTIPGGH